MGLLTPLANRIGAIPWLPRFLPQIVWVDKALHRVSGGRVTVLDLAGLPNLNLTVRGEGVIKNGDRTFVCRPGDILLFPPGEIHHYGRHPDAREWYHQWVYFRPRAYWQEWLAWPSMLEYCRHAPRRAMTWVEATDRPSTSNSSCAGYPPASEMVPGRMA